MTKRRRERAMIEYIHHNCWVTLLNGASFGWGITLTKLSVYSARTILR
jgi:hypothetical protein